ncbi:MAG: hypothetical protein ABIC04_01075 [Nanoarchaeota archaeon]
MKCSICGRKMDTTFLEKVVGAYVRKKGSSKKYAVCQECQKKLKTKEELVDNIKK